ncbi:MAG: helix-hairpin-helix domain-containing protein [Acidobacteria bacterium]|nr:helix-hairpin-helix domain-containing protein [Acidobacteriota bacterium]
MPDADLVDLNRGTLAELDTLPGVGPRTAQRIVEYREENGGFTRLEELMNVRGIGERTFLRLKPLVTVGSPDER